METMTLSCRKRSWNGKPRRFPAGNDRGMENHDAFLRETIVEWRITTLSCRKRSWNGESRRFPAGNDRGLENHDAFLQERIVAVKFIEFRVVVARLVPNEASLPV